MKTKIALVVLVFICLYFAWLVPQEDKAITQWSVMAKQQAVQIDKLRIENDRLRTLIGKDSVTIETAQRPIDLSEVYYVDFEVTSTNLLGR